MTKFYLLKYPTFSVEITHSLNVKLTFGKKNKTPSNQYTIHIPKKNVVFVHDRK